MKLKRAIIIPDTHIPHQDKVALNAVMQFVCDQRPDYFIHLGDLCDFASLSRFSVMSKKDLTSLDFEVDETNKFLDQLDVILPEKCKKVMITGNHDQRPEMYRLNNWDAKAIKLLGRERLDDADVLFKLGDRGWHVVPFGETFQLGHATFAHGFFVNKYHSQKTVTRFFRSIYYGHTHDHQSHTVVGMDGLPVEAMSLGTLQKFDASWLRGVPPNWVHMFAYMDIWGKNYNLYPVHIVNGAFCAEGKYYHG